MFLYTALPLLVLLQGSLAAPLASRDNSVNGPRNAERLDMQMNSAPHYGLPVMSNKVMARSLVARSAPTASSTTAPSVAEETASVSSSEVSNSTLPVRVFNSTEISNQPRIHLPPGEGKSTSSESIAQPPSNGTVSTPVPAAPRKVFNATATDTKPAIRLPPSMSTNTTAASNDTAAATPLTAAVVAAAANPGTPVKVFDPSTVGTGPHFRRPPVTSGSIPPAAMPGQGETPAAPVKVFNATEIRGGPHIQLPPASDAASAA